MIPAERAQFFTISIFTKLGKNPGVMWEKSSELEHAKICVVDE